MKNLIYILLAIVLHISSAIAENNFQRCASFAPSHNIRQAVEAKLAAYESAATAYDVAPIAVPVAFHIIQTSTGANKVTESQLAAQIDQLNTAYAGQFIFTLSSIDTTIKSSWFVLKVGSRADVNMRTTLRAGGAGTLNVYLNRPYYRTKGDLLGVSPFPWDYAQYAYYDGIAILYSTVPGGSSRSYNQGDTLTHEVGHWLGLYHTFEPPNSSRSVSSSNNGCKGRGDRVSDTPAERVPHYSCKSTDSCSASGKDPIRNFMNYTPDSCMNTFSSGQLTRAISMWNLYRAQ